MKTIIALAVLSLSASVFATTLEEALRKVETQRGASCTKINQSTSICTGSINGTPATCFYNVKFSCDSRDGGFGLKIKMVENWNYRENNYEARVRKVIIVR